jgi:hypothetical protein
MAEEVAGNCEGVVEAGLGHESSAAEAKIFAA